MKAKDMSSSTHTQMHPQAQSTKQSTYIPGIDALRALSIVAIILYHAHIPWMSGGFLGVPVFFAISGYLITLSIEREMARSGSFNYLKFIGRRIRRLWPAVLVLIAGTTLLTLFMQPTLLSKVQADMIPAAGFFANIHYIVQKVSYFAAAGSPSPLTHLWFMGLIMQLYIAWPLVLLLLARIAPNRKVGAGMVLVLALASAATMAVLFNPQEDTARIYYGFDTRAGEFLIGAFGALVTHGRGLTIPQFEKKPQLYPICALSILVLLGLATTLVSGQTTWVYQGGLFAVACLTTVLIAILARPQIIITAGPLSWVQRLLSAVGKRGFSLYLWHYPLLILLNPATRTTTLEFKDGAIQVLLIVLVAELSYQLFEKSHIQNRWTLSWLQHNVILQKLQIAGDPAICNLLLIVSVATIAIFPLVPLDTEAVQRDNGADYQQFLTRAAAVEVPHDGTLPLEGTTFEKTALADTITTINNLKDPVTPTSVDVSDTSTSDLNVLLIGDSVPAGAITQFKATFPHGTIDAKVGRQFGTGIDLYNQYASTNPEVVIFSIGDNGVVKQAQIDELLNTVPANKRVYFVTVRVPLDLQDMNNELFRQTAQTHDNVGIIDWYAASEGHDEYFWSDGTHLRPAGARAFMALIKQTIS